MILKPGLRAGTVSVPVSKSHAHRLFIADFLAGGSAFARVAETTSADLRATAACLAALASAGRGASVTLDCGESGTTRRLLGPVVAALGMKADWRMRGRLAMRPQLAYDSLGPGVHTLAGDVSSQFASGLLFALPLLSGDSEIRFASPLASRGYVELTRDVLSRFGIASAWTGDSIRVPGRQTYRLPAEEVAAEADWSGAAFWLAMNALGSRLAIATPLAADSLQPDRAVTAALTALRERAAPRTIEVDSFPDSFPVLAVVAALSPGETHFRGTRRLRLKESDRVEAMREVLTRFGVRVAVREDSFVVHGGSASLGGGVFPTFGDHRVAMSVAVGATRAEAPVEIDGERCADKSFPGFFDQFNALAIVA